MENSKTNKTTANCIDVKVAREMIANYEKEAGGLPSYTKSVWFSLDNLEKIIQKIREEQADAGHEDKRYGVRFYFGQYGDKVSHTTINGMDVDYSKRNTILMVSTEQGEADNKKPLFNRNYYGVCVIPIENKGELCPDQCLGDDLP